MNTFFELIAKANNDDVFGLILFMAVFVVGLLIMTGIVNFALWIEKKTVVEPFRKKYGFTVVK